MFPLLAQIGDVAPQFYNAGQQWPPQQAIADPAVVAASAFPSAPVAAAQAPPPGIFQSLLARLNALDANGWERTAYEFGLKAVGVLMLLTMAWTVSGWASSIVRGFFDRIKFDETLSIFLSKLVRWAILLLAALTCLNKFGVETTSFAALIGAAGLAIGLAFQGTLSNFAAGAMLLLFRPYKVGDEVTVAGYTGTVREIELFTTAIDTGDYRRVIIPNSSIYGAVIENVTHHPVRRFDFEVGTAYSADIDATRRVLERAVQSVVHVVQQPAPAVVLLGLGASSVNWSVRGFAKRESYGAAKEAVIRAVKMELDAARIAIPFPQLDLHLDPQEAEPARLAA
jgi:small conductance mechanosensitive channel